MDSVLTFIRYWCHDFWEEYGDKRISHLPMLNGGPWHVIMLTLLYLYFVKVWGPNMMKNRPPYELRGVMLFHNIFLVLLNGIGFLMGIWGTKLGYRTLKCEPFDPSSDQFDDKILFYLGYTYYISKYIDFLDTVYFVLRKKYTHISGLHVFHHTMMPFWCYIFFKFSSYTNNGFIPLINAFVHTVMYSYYALAAFGPQMKPFLWWKKYITQLQLIQFVAATIHSTYMLLDTTCSCSKLLISFQALHSILFFNLFYNFYQQAYGKREKIIKAQ
ncbi:very long chain fatty acid elongase AAEL008004-like [Brevipalpus obovatus]|uniref:very long chain fatty acid elongase AAEL008004-like n=1 Tax=Brevipalpus obovatus TaxID=246614 RepID=UPI003D9DDEBE